jgi:hypothetical protein
VVSARDHVGNQSAETRFSFRIRPKAD